MDRVLDVAIRLSERIGYVNLTKKALCIELRIPEGSFNSVYGAGFKDLLKKLNCTLDNREITRERILPALRKEQILKEAVKIAQETHYLLITREKVAEKCGISPQLINTYYDSIKNLQNEVKNLIYREV